MTESLKSGRIGQQFVLAIVRWWCLLRHPQLCSRTFRRSGKLPDPATPTTDVDKFLWRKIFDHNPMFTTACDKLAAKKYALSICPNLKTAEVLWVGRDPELIPEHLLCGSVVVKGNHGSRWNIIIQDGQCDRTEMRKRAASWVNRTYGKAFGEWGYRDARHCLFVESMLLEKGKPVRKEYKFHVSDSRVTYVFVSLTDEWGKERTYYFSRDGLIFPTTDDASDSRPSVALPDDFERMCDIAERLAAPFDYMRCDFYELDGEVYFSELTAYPLSGQGGSSSHLRALRNARWDLRKSWFLTEPQTGWHRIYAAALRAWLDENALPDNPA